MKVLCWNLGAAAGRWRDDPALHDRAWHWIAAVDPDNRREEIARPSVGVPWWNDVAFAGFRDLVDGRRFIIAGDWNTSRWADVDGIPTPAGAEFFARAAAAGWVELSLDSDGREGKTWYGSTNPRTHLPDHVFADAETAATLRSFRIDPYPVEAQGLSDHAPMILELDLEIAAPETPPVEAFEPAEAVPA